MERINQIICEKRSYSREFQSHQHTFGQFLFPLQGSLDIQTNHQKLHLEPDYGFYLPPNFHHHYRSVDRNEFLILDIPLRYLPGDTKSMHIRLDKQWTAIRYLLLEEVDTKENLSALTDLTRYVTKKLQTSNPPSIDYIHKHFKEPIRLETLAKIEHYHPVYYSEWFKKRTSKSPQAYILELRLEEAEHLLLSTEWSISGISEELGFENASSFTRWFTRHKGFAPKKYRDL
ncbi:AraC family transcriptional regulator [Oceanobacillus sp. CFH 90083]|uniref:helix-turn-helix transcriptional regulator n=1 Tax=Oceanobacillus sp. CFH 90083 TaxID=2592336 RepID=UPI001883B34C|nr:AraC family transcriptional regulator [Oceanobacillus sp. CFH 90083]